MTVPYSNSDGICTTTATFVSFGLWTTQLFSLYGTFLAFLTVCHNWSERRLKRIEPWLQSSIYLVALAVAIAPIPLGYYNPSERVCWINSKPLHCKQTYLYGPDQADCERGDNAGIVRLVYVVLPMGPCLFLSVVFMYLIYQGVRTVEHRSSRYLFPPAASSSGSMTTMDTRMRRSYPLSSTRSRLVAKRALRMTVCFLVTYSLKIVRVVYLYITGTRSPWLTLFTVVLDPIQGFFNAYIFMAGRTNMLTCEGRVVRYLFLGHWLPSGLLLCRGGSTTKDEQDKPPSQNSNANANNNSSSGDNDQLVEGPITINSLEEGQRGDRLESVESQDDDSNDDAPSNSSSNQTQPNESIEFEH